MKRPPAGRRVQPLRVIVLVNIVVIVSLYAFLQWRFSAMQGQHLTLPSQGNVAEQDTKVEAAELEALAKKTFQRDRELRSLAPPVDWEGIATEGAERIKSGWDAVADKVWYKQPGYHLSYPENDPPYPFQRVKFVDGRDTGIMLLAAPFYDTNFYRAEAARSLFWRLKARGHIMVGLTSYQEFPGRIANPFDDRHTTEQDDVILGSLEAWLHCFRNPDEVLPSGVPRLLLSESDFHDPDRNDGGGSLVPDPAIKKEWDLVLSNQGGQWNDFARNWTVAKASVKRLVAEMGLKVLILGRDLEGEEDADLQPLLAAGSIKAEPPGRPWRDFLKTLQTARALFVPNVHDASPRVIVEALCLDVPVVVNRNILGGWKYVTRQTGEFFDSEDNVVEAFTKLRAADRAAELFPRDWYKSNWGKERAVYRLQAFMEAVVGADRLAAVQRELQTVQEQLQHQQQHQQG